MAEQQTFEQIVESWEAFLRQDPKKHYIRIKNIDNGVMVGDHTRRNPTLFFIDDIEKEAETVSKWVDTVIKRYGLKSVEVQFRKKSGGNGAVKHPDFNDTPYDVSKRLSVLKAQNSQPMETNNEPVAQQTTPAFSAPQPPPPQHQPTGLGAAVMQGLGGTAATAQAAGLGLSQFIDMQKRADRADEYKEELLKLKEENSTLKIKNNELQAKVDSAAEKQELAIMKAELSKKGFLDGEAGQEIIRALPGILASLTDKSGNPSQGLGMPNMSPEKQKFMEYLADPDVTPEMVRHLEQELVRIFTSGQQPVQMRKAT